MTSLTPKNNKYKIPPIILNWLNLRADEAERTILMFGVFTTTSIAMLWVEHISIALFLDSFGVKSLPFIYISSAIMGSGLGVIYSWLQKNFPIEKVLIIVVLIMALPLVIFRIGLIGDNFTAFWGLLTVFLLRLWIDAQEILNDLNAQFTSNQLFNIREIKRTYPIISSGLLIADILAGFSLPILLFLIGLKNVLIFAILMMLLSGFFLYKITKIYHQFFVNPNVTQLEPSKLNNSLIIPKLKKAPWKYIIFLVVFFVMGKMLYLLVDFYYLGQLQVRFERNEIAGFLGVFGGILGIFELITQLFISSRAIEKLGAFISSMILPVALTIIAVITIILPSGIFNISALEFLLASSILIKFIDDLFYYTLIAGIKPFLFQALPLNIRGSVQTLVQGIAEPLTMGITGGLILAVISLLNRFMSDENQENFARVQGLILLLGIILFSLIWAITSWYLRSNYINLLVKEAEEGRLVFSTVDLTDFKFAIVEALNNNKSDIDKSSCLDLLAKIDPFDANKIIAPRLLNFSPSLQKQGLEIMLRYPNPNCFLSVQKLIYSDPPLEILALALRYVWISQTDLDLRILKPYLRENIEPILRSIALTLILQKGDYEEKEEAIAILEKMLNSPDETEKILGIKVLKDGGGKFTIKHYLPLLIQEENPTIRATVFEVIAEHRLKKYYQLILDGLGEKNLRKASKNALVNLLKEEAISLLKKLGEEQNKTDFIRLQAFNCLAEIGTPEIYHILTQQLISSWGNTRRNLLRILLKIPHGQGLDAVIKNLGRSAIAVFIDQELSILAQIYAAKIDFQTTTINSQELELLKNSLDGMQSDIMERCFLLMKFLYPSESIEATILNLNSADQASINLGLELLDNTIDLPQKNIFLELLEQGLPIKLEKLEAVKHLISYQPMTPEQRLLHLISFRHFLSAWCFACCFHLARQQKWPISSEITTIALHNPHSFVREAVLFYLKEIYPASCLRVLSKIQQDY
jgi:hypothetical protein